MLKLQISPFALETLLLRQCEKTLVSYLMILINKYEPIITIDKSFEKCEQEYVELCKIFNFIDLPTNIKSFEKINSAILKTYYANALDNNLVEIKVVKYLINKNLKGTTLAEKAIEQYYQAELFLSQQIHQPLSISLIKEVIQIITGNFNFEFEEKTIFNKTNLSTSNQLNSESEIELESLFDFLNRDSEFHPIVQSWILHFKLRSFPIINEGANKLASLFQQFWLQKKQMDLEGLLSLEHELYLNKLQYEEIINCSIAGESNILNKQLTFGLQLHLSQINRLKDLLKSYFRKQVSFDKLNPRQKNIMNYVFERGYKLKEIDDSILNKRQKLIMYIIQHKGFISTKESVNEFDCNRKTIQRDFQTLMDMGLVKSIGAGAGLRYCINLQEKRNPQLEHFQADFLRNNKEEIFTNDGYYTYSSSSL